MRRYPGKFEGCSDQRLGEALYMVAGEGGCAEELGDVDGFGWYGLIISRNKKVGYIVFEDGQGFFDYQDYTLPDARHAWANIERQYAKYMEDVDNDISNC